MGGDVSTHGRRIQIGGEMQTIAVPRRFERPVLACGARRENAFCIGVGDCAHLGPQLGDLDGPEALRAYEEAAQSLERSLGVTPELFAHDLDPGCLSTRYARGRGKDRAIGVQHHHAHVASAMAEHGLHGPVIGLAWDGGGYGTDGTDWGGELLLADFSGFERLATFRPIALSGGHLALALVDDAFDGDPPQGSLPALSGIPEGEVRRVREAIRSGEGSPLSHGVGRLFEAVGALAPGRGLSECDEGERGAYPLPVDIEATPWEVDTRPMVRAIVGDLRAGAPLPAISARFHNALAKVAAELCRRAARLDGKRPVVLGGGCFQNALLAERIREGLAKDFQVHLPREVPPGDGGLSLGQALVASALAGRS